MPSLLFSACDLVVNLVLLPNEAIADSTHFVIRKRVAVFAITVSAGRFRQRGVITGGARRTGT